jgi:hypothetical protein
MDYTPRQIEAFLIILKSRQQYEWSQQLVFGALAARGDEKAIRAKLKEWES